MYIECFMFTSSLPCHQAVIFHLSTQDFAVSLNFERPSKVQGHARRVMQGGSCKEGHARRVMQGGSCKEGHCSMCAVFSVARLHSHGVSPSKYFHFFRCSLLHV